MSEDDFKLETGFTEANFRFGQSNVKYGQNGKLVLFLYASEMCP